MTKVAVAVNTMPAPIQMAASRRRRNKPMASSRRRRNRETAASRRRRNRARGRGAGGRATGSLTAARASPAPLSRARFIAAPQLAHSLARPTVSSLQTLHFIEGSWRSTCCVGCHRNANIAAAAPLPLRGVRCADRRTNRNANIAAAAPLPPTGHPPAVASGAGIGLKASNSWACKRGRGGPDVLRRIRRRRALARAKA